MRYNTYKKLTDFLSPLVALWLRLRLRKGKEDKARFGERFGYSKLARPQGVLTWIHAASVGEANSVLPLIDEMNTRFPEVKILLTTGTVTSARLVAGWQREYIIHQYIPVDTPEAVNRFLRRWKPDIGFWVESELWPNLVISARARGCFMVIINGRMSVKSFDGWQKRAPLMMYQMLQCFEVSFAQSEDDAKRFRALGASDVRCAGNIKYDALTLPCDEKELFSMQQRIKNRPVWLAASTHDDEEIKVAEAHNRLAPAHPNLLTIIAPRHPQRGAEIAEKLAKFGNVALRSRGELIGSDTKFYIADTLGELGLFYRLCEIVFMGGSLIPHGGQNPLEPLRLRCAIITGKHTDNFKDMYQEMYNIGACGTVRDSHELAAFVHSFMSNSEEIVRRQTIDKEWLAKKTGATARILNTLSPIFAPLENN